MSDEFEKENRTESAADIRNDNNDAAGQSAVNDDNMQKDRESTVYRYSRDQINGHYEQNDSANQNNYGQPNQNRQSYSQGGFNRQPYGQNGYNQQGYGQNGYNQQGYGQYSYNQAYGQPGNNRQTYNQEYYHQAKPAKKPKKQRKFGGLAKVVCYALVFGIIAGGVMEGIHLIGNTAAGTSKTQERVIDVVQVSSKDVSLIEAQDVSDIVDQVMPSIVAVNTVVETTSYDFFGRAYEQQGEGAGSGFIFSEDGDQLYLITNYHVIEDSKSIQVTFVDDTVAEATVKGYDEKADIAVLLVDMSKLEASTKDSIKVAVMGDSDAIKAGNGAIAIGNALGYGQSVTTGAISAVARDVQLTDGTMTLIQTSAAINPGNSGGALLNTRGEVIGINTVKYSETTVEGMGFAIPINSALETANAIIKGEIVNRSDADSVYLGIKGGTVSESMQKQYNMPKGVYVSSVYTSSSAYRGGIQPGYVISQFNGTEIDSMETLQACLAECSPGDSVNILVYVPNSQGEYTSQERLTIVLGSMEEAPQE